MNIETQRPPASRKLLSEISFLDIRASYLELKAELDEAFSRVMNSGRYILGPEVHSFEEEFAAWCGTRHCVAVGNGQDALTLILRAMDVGAGDEVLVPSNTFIATWFAVSTVGAVPVPVEFDESTFNIDPSKLAGGLTSRTRAIIPVHLFGQPADMDPIRAFAERHGLRVIEDAAQAHGARYNGRSVGALADAAAFSFYPSKNLGGFGDGGAVTTDDAGLAERVRLLRNSGSARKYEHDVVGQNSRLDELQAAFLRVKLRKADAWNDRRRATAQLYLRLLGGIPGLVLPQAPAWAEPVWHLFVVRHAERDRLARELMEAGVATMMHYPVPPHLQPAYKGAVPSADLRATERAAQEGLSLPIGPHQSPEQTTAVASQVRDFKPIGRA